MEEKRDIILYFGQIYIPDFSHCSLVIKPSRSEGGLFLGDKVAAENIDYIKQKRIQCVLNVSGAQITYPQGLLVESKLIHVDDNENSDISQFFSECIKFIDVNRRQGRNVLVHCSAGMSRSPTILLSYLMIKHKMGFSDAYKQLQNKRPCVMINDGFKKQLQTLDEDLNWWKKFKERLWNIFACSQRRIKRNSPRN